MSTATATSTFTLTETTQRVLKNFAQISTSLLLREGTEQKTVNASKSVLAIAQLPTPWPQETAVYQLPELLSNLSAYANPVLEFEEKNFIIRGTNSPSHVVYPYSDPSVVMAAPNKTFDVSNPVAQFTLPEKAVAEIKKLSAINNLPTIVIEANSDKGTIVVKPHDEKNPASRVYSYPVHADKGSITTLTGGTFAFKFKREHFDLLMDGGYTVSIGNWPYAYFQHVTEPVSYFVVQASSK